MKLGLICAIVAGSACLAGGLVACQGSNYDPVIVECEGGSEAATPKELVCAPDFCGTIADKLTGATADCGSCPSGSQCGDNGKGNVCGSSCMPLTASDGDGGTYPVTPACTYAFGPDWNAGYGIGLQFPPSCSYADPNNCLPIYNDPGNGPCAGTVCGAWICCVSDPDAGINPLLPGAVANNDGGLP